MSFLTQNISITRILLPTIPTYLLNMVEPITVETFLRIYPLLSVYSSMVPIYKSLVLCAPFSIRKILQWTWIIYISVPTLLKNFCVHKQTRQNHKHFSLKVTFSWEERRLIQVNEKKKGHKYYEILLSLYLL